MSARQYRDQLERKRKQRVEADRKAGAFRATEAKERAAAARSQRSATSAKSSATERSRLREAARHEEAANKAAKNAADWQVKAAGFAKEEASIMKNLARAERSENASQQRARERQETRAQRELADERAVIESRLEDAEHRIDVVLERLPEPQEEKLRILLLGASPEGDVRVGREQKRIRAAVEAALHRDRIELDVRPAATSADLLDGLTRFRPHVVHFSGHSNETLITFEDENDSPHSGVIVTAEAFAHAVAATDIPPLLVLLNSCNSAAQIDQIVATVAPLAIGMSAEIGDSDAISYAAQFYAAVANGQSVAASHLSGKAALELAGLDSSDLPTLAHASTVDPTRVILVLDPERAVSGDPASPAGPEA
ncbi:hypothetical protein [Microbacterium oleivorans]|uniref:CHAT domain-containing protein n=1 Tax=Microbacterium oleivorans TaxID=273677 RepID=A0A4R5YL32_9MICO|nr:hypothetical protein [Microbacterium oleivorans]TDL45291.1 hypothetical protein E2R54_02165 [Microbacterium oleivorans]